MTDGNNKVQHIDISTGTNNIYFDPNMPL